MTFSGVMLFVKDLPRMTTFYSGVLGSWPIEETRLTDWVEFQIEGMGLPLLERPWGGVEAVDPEGNVFALRPRSARPERSSG